MASLRRAALGRKKFLFVGGELPGHNLEVLYTLVASCEKHAVNPIDYLTDVLTRVHSPPVYRLAVYTGICPAVASGIEFATRAA